MEKIKKFLTEYLPHLSIDESTYTSDHKKCRFVDFTYGEFWTLPYSILRGATKGHPAGRHERAKATNIEKYGVANPSHRQEIIDKIKKSNTATADEIQDRIRSINPDISIKKDTYINTHAACLMIDKTYGEFWCRPHNILSGAQKGHPDAPRSPHDEAAARVKREATMESLYGSKSPLMIEKFKEKARKTTLERFGFDHASKNPEIRKKIGDARRGKPFKSPEKLRINVDEIERRCKEKNPNISIDKDSYRDTKTKCRFIEIGVGEFWAVPEYVMNGHTLGHPSTSWDRSHATRKENGTLWSSNAERDLNAFVESLGLKTEKRRKGGYEIDIFIPAISVGIEYNGLFYHNEDRKSKQYHSIKTKMANSDGIRLIHVWEHEWLHKRREVMNFLKGALGVGKSIGARKCNFLEINADLAKEFCTKNHLRGAPIGVSVAYGAFFEDTLLGVATFGSNPRNNKEINLTRLCFEDSIHIPGALSKFSKMAATHFQAPIYTFVELDKSQGSSYLKSGWVIVAQCKPDYFYANLKNQSVVSKQSRKKKTVKTPPGMTEKEHAIRDGLIRIWDCGKIKLVFNHSASRTSIPEPPINNVL